MTGEPVVVGTCYGAVVATFSGYTEATAAMDDHIRRCPQGAMPWAREITWYLVKPGIRCAAAGGQWLDHQLRPAADQQP